MKKITIAKDGPYLVQGGVPLANQNIVTNAQGESMGWREGEAVIASTPAQSALCRCGKSGTKPFCDGTHVRIAFDGTETASREPYAVRAEHIAGPVLVL